MGSNKMSAQSVEVVKATVPVLLEHGSAIIQHFYRHLHHDHPELELLFNPANQGSGDAKTRASQQETFRQDFFGGAKSGTQGAALVSAVQAYAANLDNLSVLKGAVTRIAHKHASIGVTAEQYPIIGSYLLAAIKAVLGDAATDEIINAWREAYGILADLFIEVETDLTASNAQKPGGWAGFRPFIVHEKVPESDGAISVYLVPQDGGPLPDYGAGQYVCFRVEVPGYKRRGGSTVYRNYSLSSAPGKGYLRVTVKREPGAKGHPAGVCSTFFHDTVAQGDILHVSAPFGEFTLAEVARPLVFIGAGIGITPIFSMFQHALDRKIDKPIHFFEAMRNGRTHPLRREIEALAQRHPNVVLHRCYSHPLLEDRLGEDYHTQGRLTQATLAEVLPDLDRDFYFVGPISFMRSVRGALHALGVPAERVHYECFGPHAAEIEADVR